MRGLVGLWGGFLAMAASILLAVFVNEWFLIPWATAASLAVVGGIVETVAACRHEWR